MISSSSIKYKKGLNILIAISEEMEETEEKLLFFLGLQLLLSINKTFLILLLPKAV
jgi:hypothetical protein